MAAREQLLSRFGAALGALHDDLDWELLEGLYCEGDAAGFFGPEQRAAILDAGLLVSEDVAGALAELEQQRATPGPGRSLYLGAAVAELAPILFERIVLGREVVWLNLPGPETVELNRAMARVVMHQLVDLPEIETRPPREVERASCDLLWMASVLSDPERFPALHDHLYRRKDTQAATGRGDLEQERAWAEALLDEALACLALPAVLFTSDEELPLVRAACERREWKLNEAPTARLSGIVGDPVRACRITRSQ